MKLDVRFQLTGEAAKARDHEAGSKNDERKPGSTVARISEKKGVNVTNGTMLWAGKELSGEEEARLRKVVHMLRRNGGSADAECLERFLPENLHLWTSNELETAAHAGPWMSFGAQLQVEEGGLPADGEGPSAAQDL